MSWVLDLTPAARRDIDTILRASTAGFGPQARERYAALVAMALADLRQDPRCLGSVARPELLTGTWTYHLRHCRRRLAVGGLRVGAPRHLIAYRIKADNVVVVLRVLHDAMELAARLGGDEAGIVGGDA